MTTSPVYETSHNGIKGGSLTCFVDRLMRAIEHEEPVMAVLGADESAVLSVVDECVAMLSGQSIRVIRVRGSLSSPLTLPRIVQELSVSERGGLSADDDELIVRILAKPINKQGRTLLIIEQAELVPPRTLAFLQIVSTVFGTTAPRLHLLFVGHPKFERLVEKEELAGIHDRLGTIVRVVNIPAEKTLSLSTSNRPDDGSIQNKTTTTSRLGRHRRALLISATVIIIVISSVTAWKYANETTANSVLVSGPMPAGLSGSQMLPQTPQQSPGMPQAPSLTPLPQTGVRESDPAAAAQPDRRRSWPTGEQLARLQQEFEHFLVQTERGSKRQSETERSRLFQEFLQWNYGAADLSPERLSQIAVLPLLARARVTFYFRAGSTSGKDMARRFATTIRSSVALARTRSAADVPRTFEVRYSAQEDEVAAEALAQRLQVPDATWVVRLIPSAQPAPVAHTIEFWIPLR